MKWINILEAIFAAPSILLEKIIQGWQEFWMEEHELALEGEFDEEDKEDYHE